MNKFERAYNIFKKNIKDMGAGSGGGLLAVVVNDGETFTLDKTWNEIYNAMSAGLPVYVVYPNDYPSNPDNHTAFVYAYTSSKSDGTIIDYRVATPDDVYYTSTPDGYPVYFTGDSGDGGEGGSRLL